MVESEVTQNMRAFNEQLPLLLRENSGRYAVGRAGDRFECWDTYTDALTAGYRKYQNKSFVVSPVGEIPRVHSFPGNLTFVVPN